MKVTVSVELDLTNNPALNVKTIKDLRGSLQNLGSFIHELHLTNLDKLLNCHGKPHSDPVFQKALLENYEADVKISEGLFDNYRVQGITEDGHMFDFSHKKSYVEVMTIDGKETQDYD